MFPVTLQMSRYIGPSPSTASIPSIKSQHHHAPNMTFAKCPRYISASPLVVAVQQHIQLASILKQQICYPQDKQQAISTSMGSLSSSSASVILDGEKLLLQRGMPPPHNIRVEFAFAGRSDLGIVDHDYR